MIIFIHNHMMDNEFKKHYDAPSTLVFEVKIEGFVCQSILDILDDNGGGMPGGEPAIPF